MSATNRGAERREADFYPTPAWCTRRILERLPFQPASTYLDPAAGDGALVRVIRERDARAEIVALELREEAMPALAQAGADIYVQTDAFEIEWPAVDVVIMNPPFSLAIEFAERAIAVGKHVVCLERIGWLCTWGKSHPENMPSLFVLPERPSFTGTGTDASEYAWMVWGLKARFIEMLPRTPLAERKDRT